MVDVVEEPKKKPGRGGPRANSGGARPGAGRPPKGPEPINVGAIEDPMEFLLSVMKETSADGKLRIDAAKAVLPFKHSRIGGSKKPEGKKAELERQANEIAGKFTAGRAPLKAVK